MNRKINAATFLFLGLLVMASNGVAEIGLASWYDSKSVVKEGTCKTPGYCLTASGKEINGLEKEKIMFAASNSYHLGALVRVFNLKNGKSVTCRIYDRGGFERHGRIIDLCKRAFTRLADTKLGTIKVKIEKVK